MVQIGRFTAKHERPLVVFLIGMRVNNWLRWREWLPVARAMGPTCTATLRPAFWGPTAPFSAPTSARS